jgi:L-ascorbate metabolism protein UlaG (beta-lactamase superfamily)
VRVTWWGHATVSILGNGTHLLTDPVLGNRVAHLRRRRGQRPVLPSPPDAVLISHLHADHFNVASLRTLPGVPLIVPSGGGALVRRTLGHRWPYREVRAGAELVVGDLRVRAVPANHADLRHPWSRHRADAVGYVVEGEHSVWFAGDTDLFAGMTDLGQVDLALIPVGGWGPTLGPGHLDPARAAEAVRRCNPTAAVPIHYGTLWPYGLDGVRPDMFHLPGERFAEHTRALAPNTITRLLAPGESLTVRPATVP